MESIYRQLQRKLNTIGTGVPESPSGADVTCLEMLYTREEAEFALKMDKGLHTAQEFADSMELPLGETEAMLEQMSRDGLVYRVRDGAQTKYYLVPAYHGFFEFNVGRLDQPMAKSMSKHFGEGMGSRFFAEEAPIFRFIPLRPDLVEGGECLEIDNVEKILRRQKKIAVTKCFCRLSAATVAGENTCKATPPENYEMCLVLGDFAEFYLENGIAREITVEEALEIMAMGEKNGTACEVMNTKNVEVMCNCCACCCGVIVGFRAFGGKSKSVASNYRVKYDPEACSQCLDCLKRCPTRALKAADGKVTYDPARCLGCGLCLSACPSRALTLHRKPEEELYYPADDTVVDLYENIEAMRRKTREI